MLKCPTCGANLHFDIATQKMKCDHCNNSYDPQTLNSLNSDNAQAAPLLQYVCPSCGGELITTDSNDMIGYCPFCTGAAMIPSKGRTDWEPEEIIPFQITREQCVEAYNNQLKNSFIFDRRPKKVKPEQFVGIYLPYNTYKITKKGTYNALFNGKEENSGNTKTNMYEVTGKVDYCFDYYHDVSSAFEDRLSESIAPYDLKQAKPFASGYLSGFYANSADDESEDYIGQVKKDFKKRMLEEIKRQNKRLLSGKSEKEENESKLLKYEIKEEIVHKSVIESNAESSKKTLFPVWFMALPDKKEKVYVAVNGQTGKACLDLPLSFPKIGLFILIISLILAIPLAFVPNIYPFYALGASSLAALVSVLYIKNAHDNVTREKRFQNLPDIKKLSNVPIVLIVFVALFAFLGVMVSLPMILITFFGPGWEIINKIVTPGVKLLIVPFVIFNIAMTVYWNIRYLRISKTISGIKPNFFDKRGL